MANRPGEVIPAPDADLCLSFANTRYYRGGETPTEELNAPDDLLRWAVTAGRLPASLAEHCDAATFEAALTLREAIYRCFSATASGGIPLGDDLAVLNAALVTAPARQRVRPEGWDIGNPIASAGTLLAPVLWSAADMLVGPQLARVRQCANPACGWLFLDSSKSGNRRWCSMSACGNRAKAHRHYQRRKAD